eukprot:gene6545-4719_t
MSKPVSIRVGILSAARIVNKTWEAIHRAGFQVTILGCRDVERGKAFVAEAAAKFGPFHVEPRVGSYEDVIGAKDVDVVYIPIPVTARDTWVRACVKAGKHVVGEKPPAKDSNQLREWLDLMSAKNLLYMDGTMFCHGTRLVEMKKSIAALGSIKHIDAHITFLGSEEFMKNDIRVKQDLEPYGALGDVGWYCIRWILHLVDFQMPDAVTSRIVKSTPEGAITAMEAQFRFTVKGEPVTASFYCSFTDAYLQRIRVFAADGVVTAQDCVNLPPQSRPHYFVRRAAWKPEEVSRDITDDGELVYAAEEEEDFHYQTDHLWVDVAASLQMEGGAVVPDPAKLKMLAEYAYKTQKVMDDTAAAARK